MKELRWRRKGRHAGGVCRAGVVGHVAGKEGPGKVKPYSTGERSRRGVTGVVEGLTVDERSRGLNPLWRRSFRLIEF